LGSTVIIRDKQIARGVVVELVVWWLDDPVQGCTHNFKYRLYAGYVGGSCIIRYDNERGKGDHKHVGKKEELYSFRGIVELLDDFTADVERLVP
jgi:hypothetical protein